MELVNIGFGNMLAKDKIVVVLTPESAPIRRIVHDAKEKFDLIDATCGRRTQAVIITSSRHVVLSALNPSAISNRIMESNKPDKEENL